MSVGYDQNGVPFWSRQNGPDRYSLGEEITEFSNHVLTPLHISSRDTLSKHVKKSLNLTKPRNQIGTYKLKRHE